LISCLRWPGRFRAGRLAELEQLLRKMGAAETVHTIGGGKRMDGQDLPLVEVLDGAVADGGVVISCIPGRLALFIQESPGNTFILMHKP
jgi:hypothetical protein